MQRSKWLRAIAAFAALSLLAAACGDGEEGTTDAGAETPTPDESPTDGESPDSGETPQGGAAVDGTLTIGTLLPQTGDLAVLGAPMIEAVKMAVEQVNEAGGVLGNDVRLVEGDSGTNEDVANSTADRLLQSDQVDAIVGAASSRITLSVIDKITGAGVVECSPSNTGSSLTTHETETPGFYFRTAPPDNLQGPALADVIVGDGHADVAVVALNDEYGQGFADFLKQGLEEQGANVVADVAYDPNGTDFTSDVQQVLDADPDAVAIIGFPDTGSQIITGLLEGGMTPDQFYTADGMQGTDVIKNVDPNDPTVLDGMKGTAPSSQGSEQFNSDFAEFAPDTDTIFSAHAYDCAVIIMLAAAAADTDDPGVFHEEMVQVTKGGEKCDSPASCLELIEGGTTDIDYDGASGPGEWVDEGEPSAGTYEIWQFDNGEVTTLDTVDVQEDA